jgi:hypothetical protein
LPLTLTSQGGAIRQDHDIESRMLLKKHLLSNETREGFATNRARFIGL